MSLGLTTFVRAAARSLLIRVAAVWVASQAGAAEDKHFGPLFDEFDLTLTAGHRTEAVGPFFYSEQKDTQKLWAVPPLFSYANDPGTESKELDFVFPLLTYIRFGQQYRWQFFQLLSFA